MSFKHIKTREQFIERVNAKHDGFFSYDKVKFEDRGFGLNFKGEKTRKLPEYYSEAYVIVTCPKHGDFSIRARKHVEGAGCRSCAIEKVSSTRVKINMSKEHSFYDCNPFIKKEDYLILNVTNSDKQKKQILISEKDEEILHFTKWYPTGHQKSRRSRTNYCVGSRTVRIKQENLEWLGTTPKIHRLIMSRILGRKLLKNEVVDHINENGLDNRRENLRIATRIQNQANQRKQSTKTTSRYKGVCLDRGRNRWMSYIGSNKDGATKRIYLGYWANTPTNEIEAARAYDRAALEIYGEFANLNFPREDYK
jgi:hypothetical protein